MIEIQVSKNRSFSLDYKVDEDNCVTEISNVWQLYEGEKYKEHSTPSRRLRAALIDALETELNK